MFMMTGQNRALRDVVIPAGYVVKTDTEGRLYEAWKFKYILDSRECFNTPDDIEYKIKWTAPWPVT